MLKWYPSACPVCGGDLHDDGEDRGWATCMMCARFFPLANTAPAPPELRDGLGHVDLADARRSERFGAA